MKKLIACAFIAGLVASPALLASEIKNNSTVTVKSINKHATTTANTKAFKGGGDANTGGVSLDKSTISNSKVTVKSNNTRARTSAGANSVANTGGLTAEKSKITNSTVMIDSKNQNTRTTAKGAKLFGQGASATTGGVTLR